MIAVIMLANNIITSFLAAMIYAWNQNHERSVNFSLQKNVCFVKECVFCTHINTYVYVYMCAYVCKQV